MSSDLGRAKNLAQAPLLRTTRQLAVILTLSFLFVSGGLVYWQIAKADDLLAHPSNVRLAIYSEGIQRGGIYDRNGKVLAISKVATDIDGTIKYERSYPYEDMCEPWLGFVSAKYGSTGLESIREKTLLGLTGGPWLDMLKREFSDHMKGYDVVLTVDAGLQKVAAEALKGKVGSAVVLDPKTGAVLALVSSPSFDPNSLEENWDGIITRENSPMVNHAFGLFPPGSVMKIMSSAALFSTEIDTGALYHCSGSTVVNGQTISEQNANGHGWVNYDLALAYSCNTYFAEKGLQAGQEALKRTTDDFGFGAQIPFDLPVNRSAIVRTAFPGDSMSDNLLASSYFGQGEVMVSSFHMALVVAAVANEGKMMSPYLVERVLGFNQMPIEVSEPKVWRQPLSPDQANKIKGAMIVAVKEGTAQNGRIPWVTVAAKTGSAEPGGATEAHAWYAAFAPAENPQVVVVVLVENGGSGGQTAAPIGKKIMEEALTKKGGGI
ncbi:MAG: penicillin-binding transpeptidase domain-containing protein [Peptococcaceae bacterium]|nr:penicillin-binding transpeptidase domain-containing protein [Peptococcaceae bacterium]